AEAIGRNHVDFGPLAMESPRAVDAEKAVFAARQGKLAQDLEVIAQQEQQRRRELEEYRANEAKLKATLELFNREVELTREVFQERVEPGVEMRRGDRTVA